MPGLIEELKRRNVFRVGVAYVVIAWVIAQVAELALDSFAAPDWVMKTLLLVLALGLPLALFFAWAFEMTPEGIKKEKDVDRSQSITHTTAHKLDRVIIVVLVAALGYFVVDKFMLDGPAPVEDATQSSSEQADTDRVVATVTDDAGDNFNDKSIAVLPFAHRSPDPNDQYFTDGMHDDLLTRLAKQDAFKVISRTSVMEYRDTTKNLKEVGEELGVRHILEGGVQRAGSRVRINVQLIDAQTDEHLWAETYDRELTTDNLFDIQSEITAAIAAGLHAKLADKSDRSERSAPTSSLPACDLYLKANQLTLGNNKPEWMTAISSYGEAVSIDPEFALAHVGLAEAYLVLYWTYGGDPANRAASRAAIDRAKSLDPDLPEIQMAEGFYHYWGKLDYTAALGFMDRAIELMPNHAEAHMWRGWIMRRAGRWDEALESMQRSLKLNPRAPFNWLEYGQTLSYVHRFDEALAAIGKAKALGGQELSARAYTTVVYLQQGDVQTALSEAEDTLRSSEPGIRITLWEPFLLARDFDAARKLGEAWPADFEIFRHRYNLSDTMIATALRLAGETEAAKLNAEKAIAQLLSADSKFPDDYRKHYALAHAYAAMNDRANTIKYAELGIAQAPRDAVENIVDGYYMAGVLALVGATERALKTLEPLLPGPSAVSVRYVELDPHWDDLRDDSKFKALLDKYRKQAP